MIQLRKDGIRGLMKEIQNKKLVCFGAGGHFDTVMSLYASYSLEEQVAAIVDNNASHYAGYKQFRQKKYQVISFEEFVQSFHRDDTVLLVTNNIYAMDIVDQLDREQALAGLNVYIGTFLSEASDKMREFDIVSTGNIQIPKVIHYCWFGNNEIPKEYRSCMDSWEKFCPEYEIRRWDETNFDISINQYMYQAYQNKKWAFVSDYARLKIIYDYGGIYLDCDVELLKNPDVFLSEKMFCGFEDNNFINLGLGYGAVARHPYLKRLMEYYDTLDFVNQDGSLNMVPCPVYQTEILKTFGFMDDNYYQKKDDITVFPTDVFSPVSGWGTGRITDKSYMLHHYCASWQSKEDVKKAKEMYQRYLERREIG